MNEVVRMKMSVAQLKELVRIEAISIEKSANVLLGILDELAERRANTYKTHGKAAVVATLARDLKEEACRDAEKD